MRRVVRIAVALGLVTAAAVAGPATADPVPSRVPTQASLASVMPVLWNGETWTARESPLLRQNPNHNYWLATPDNVFVDDQNHLHLIGKQLAGRWFGAGVNTARSDYSYGTYRFVVETPMSDLDPNAVVGLFTYNQDVMPSRQESDVELSRWGQPDLTAANAQWVVQPWTEPGHLVHFTVPPTSPMTYEFTWRPKAVTFRARVGTSPSGKVVNSWKSRKALPGAAQPGTQVFINLWFRQGLAPYNQTDQEVVIDSFSYTPR